MIKNRSLIDSYYGSNQNRNFDEAGDTKPLNQELIATYIDLDSLLLKCNLNKKQLFIINCLMQGYIESDVADMFKQDASVINKTVNSICNKIKKINDMSWKYEYIFMNFIKAEWSYKRCSKCKEFKPKNTDFFGNDESRSDGFRHVCKSCR